MGGGGGGGKGIGGSGAGCAVMGAVRCGVVIGIVHDRVERCTPHGSGDGMISDNSL